MWIIQQIILPILMKSTPYLKINILLAVQVGEYEVLVSCLFIKDYTYKLAYA